MFAFKHVAPERGCLHHPNLELEENNLFLNGWMLGEFHIQYFPCKDVVHDPTWNNHEKAGSLGYRVPGSNLKFQQTGFCCFLRGMKHHSNDLTKNKESKTTEKRKTKKKRNKVLVFPKHLVYVFPFLPFLGGSPHLLGGNLHTLSPSQATSSAKVRFLYLKKRHVKNDVSKNPRFRGVFRKDGQVTRKTWPGMWDGEFTRQIKVNMSNTWNT